jgi:hypothetical protein
MDQGLSLEVQTNAAYSGSNLSVFVAENSGRDVGDRTKSDVENA